MKREVRMKRDKLCDDSMKLRRLAASGQGDYEKSQRIRNYQDQVYKKYIFYDKLINAFDNKK